MIEDIVAERDIMMYGDRATHSKKTYPNGLVVIPCYNGHYEEHDEFGNVKTIRKTYYYLYNPNKEKKYSYHETMRSAMYAVDCALCELNCPTYETPLEKEDFIMDEVMEIIKK